MKILTRLGLSLLIVLRISVTASSDPNTAQDSYYKGIQYATSGKFEKAKAAFEKAAENSQLVSAAKNCLSIIKDVVDQKIKSDTAIHFFRGTDFINKNMIDDAITEFTLAIFINLKCANAYNSRGYAYGKKKQYDDAIKDYSKAIDINPDYVSAYNSRGNIYCEKEDYGLAIQDYTRAIHLRPEEANAYNNRGFVYIVKLQDRGMGCSDLQRACELGGCRNYELAKQKGYCQEPKEKRANE